MDQVRETLLTFFGCGKAKKAPGTVGSFASVIFWFFVARWFFNHQFSLVFQNVFWAIFLVLAFIYGCLTVPIYAKKFDKIDHGSIVLDEVVGQILALQLTFCLFEENYFSQKLLVAFHLLSCFFLFRLFDITKPLFIGYCDKNFKTGFGVMFDDLLAGIFTIAIVAPLMVLARSLLVV